MLLLLLLNFSSCSLKVIPAEIPYTRIDKNNIKLDSLGNGRVLFYNYGYYCPVLTCGWTTKLNIKMNGVSLGQINYSEYFIVEIKKGEYVFELTHKDTFNFKSKITLIIDENTKVIQSIPSILTNKIRITNILPEGFYSFNEVF